MPRSLWASAQVWLQLLSAAIAGDRLVELALVLQGVSQIAVGLGIVGLQVQVAV